MLVDLSHGTARASTLPTQEGLVPLLETRFFSSPYQPQLRLSHSNSPPIIPLIPALDHGPTSLFDVSL